MQCFNDEKEMKKYLPSTHPKRLSMIWERCAIRTRPASKFISMMLEFVKRHYKEFLKENNKKVNLPGNRDSQRNGIDSNDNNK